MDMQLLSAPWYRRWWGILIIVLGSLFLVLGLAFGVLVFTIYRQVKSGTFDYEKYAGSVSQVALDASQQSADKTTLPPTLDDDPRIGNTVNPRVTIIAFEDFQCPFCKEAFPTVKEMISKYADEMLFVYRDFPIAYLHADAQKAAEAGECADDQGKFWDFHDMVFTNQEHITVDDLKRYAAQLGMNSRDFDACLDSGKYEQEVKNDLKDGYDAGVTGTPTFFINGIRVPGAIPLDIFDKIIADEIQKSLLQDISQ